MNRYKTEADLGRRIQICTSYTICQSDNKHKYGQLVLCLLCILLISGCGLAKRKSQELVPYSNPEYGVDLERSEEWQIIVEERSGDIFLDASDNQGSTRIMIPIPIGECPSTSSCTKFWVDHDIERLTRLYEPRAVTTIAPVDQIADDNYEIWTATVGVAESEDSNGRSTTIQLFSISDPNDVLIQRMVYIFLGDSERLNEEAVEIMQSIVFSRREFENQTLK